MKTPQKRLRLVEMLWGRTNENVFAEIAQQAKSAWQELADLQNIETEVESEETTGTEDATETTPDDDDSIDDLFKDMNIKPKGQTKKTSYF